MAASEHDGTADGGVARRAPFRLGVFTRLVDDVAPAEVYARALTLFETAERLGFDTGWVAQHHAHKQGGLPSPLVFLSAAAARTRRLRLATGIITLPLENAVRLAEDAAVLDALCGGRLELGFGTGGDESVFSLFGREVEKRQADYNREFAALRDALSGKALTPGGPVLFPPGARLLSGMWEATFGIEGAIRAAEHGSGLLLARTAARPADGGSSGASLPLGDLQAPLVDAYRAHWTSTAATPRIGLSRSLYVAPTRAEAIADAADGIRRHARLLGTRRGLNPDMSVEELLARSDVHFGSPAEVVASLKADRLLPLATDLILQVHPIDPSLDKTLRSLSLLATEVAPALGWHSGSHQHTEQPVAGARH